MRGCRSQSPHITAGNAELPGTLVSKARARKGGRNVGCGMSIPVQGDNRASSVPKMAKQEAEICDPATWDWVEASVWTDRMLAALATG